MLGGTVCLCVFESPFTGALRDLMSYVKDLSLVSVNRLFTYLCKNLCKNVFIVSVKSLSLVCVKKPFTRP